jgi:2-polyprenyl-6-methoxyphenol hydroxylase-like FAD-dependent oxidoreductase
MAMAFDDDKCRHGEEKDGRRAATGMIESIFGDQLESLEQDHDEVRVRLSKGGLRTFDFVVAADGLHSQTRKMAFGWEGEGKRIKRLGSRIVQLHHSVAVALLGMN